MAKISAIVLAAGAARRFGRPKQLERWPSPDGPTLVERVTALALDSGVSRVVVVTGNRADEVAEALRGLQQHAAKPLELVFNPRWEEGQGFSVAAGVKALPPGTGAALFMLADQPRLKLATLNTLIDYFDQWCENEAAILFPTYQGRRGNPALFGQPYFAALANLTGDSGGREIVKAHPEAVTEVPVDDPAILEDVDTPQDLEKLR